MSTQKAMELLKVDKKQELMELADAMGISTTKNDWEETLLKACLYFDQYLKYLIEPKSATKSPTEEKIHKIMTLVRETVNESVEG